MILMRSKYILLKTDFTDNLLLSWHLAPLEILKNPPTESPPLDPEVAVTLRAE